MTPEKIVAAFSLCSARIHAYAAKEDLGPLESRQAPEPESALPRGERESLEHALYMCEEATRFLTENPARVGKANRWLGCVQWTLWIQGVSSLQELKEMNK